MPQVPRSTVGGIVPVKVTRMEGVGVLFAERHLSAEEIVSTLRMGSKGRVSGYLARMAFVVFSAGFISCRNCGYSLRIRVDALSLG